MPSITFDGLKDLQKSLQATIDGIPERRRELHEQVAASLKAEVDRQIDSRLNDSHGKIRGWQESAVGSGGGYAAVRAKKGDYKGYAIGYIVNALESGHAIRQPQERRKGYRARIKTKYVLGRGFYKASRGSAEKIALEAANRWADEIAKALGG